MKKLLPLIAALTFIFSGCTTTPYLREIEVNRNFTAKAIITQNSAAYTADFEINQNGCSAAFVLPEEIAGLKISFDGTAFTYSLGNLVFNSPPKKEMNQFLPLIYSALTDRGGTTIKEEAHYSVSGSTEHGSYYLNINKDTFIPSFLEFESAGLTVRFENVRVNQTEIQA